MVYKLIIQNVVKLNNVDRIVRGLKVHDFFFFFLVVLI